MNRGTKRKRLVNFSLHEVVFIRNFVQNFVGIVCKFSAVRRRALGPTAFSDVPGLFYIIFRQALALASMSWLEKILRNLKPESRPNCCMCFKNCGSVLTWKRTRFRNRIPPGFKGGRCVLVFVTFFVSKTVKTFHDILQQEASPKFALKTSLHHN